MRILHVGYGFRPWRAGGLIAYAEDVMEGQAKRGHEVAYLFRGRHYPGVPDDRMHPWSRRGVAMREILNSTLVFGGDSGTLTPEADLQHPPSERHFERTLDAFGPDVVHIQEMIGLPTAIIDLLHLRQVPMLATLQDYLPLCPTLKLYDVDRQICLRDDVGAQCARCSAHAPAGRRAFLAKTAHFELRRRLGERGAPQAVRAARRVGRAAGASRGAPEPDVAAQPAAVASPLAYQARRDTNVRRLNRLDVLVAQSRRVAEIYERLGVDPGRIRTIQLTLGHLEAMTVQPMGKVTGPLRFAVVNAAASEAKGAEVLLGALTELHAAGLGARFTLAVFGYLPDTVAEALSRFPSVRLAGEFEPQHLDRMLRGLHVGIVPSVWEEAYGYVGVEFLAKGIPVIGNARGGIVDYTREGETGWVNHGADAPGLASIMTSLIVRPEEVLERHRWLIGHRDEVIKPLGRHLDELDHILGEIAARDDG